MKEDKNEKFEELDQDENEEKSKKKNKGNSFLKIILVITFIIAAIIGFLIYTKDQKNKKKLKEEVEYLKRIEIKRPNTELGKRLSAIDKLMRPKSIAIYGASRKPGSISSDLLKVIKNNGYKGKIFPINPKGGKINGIKAYKNINDIIEDIDLAMIVVKAKYVLESIDECHKKGIKALIIISAGFKEIGGKGIELEKEMHKKIEQYGMKCVGPNVMGVINREIEMDASFDRALPEKGEIGFVSQSGALGSLFFTFLDGLKIGIDQFVSIGNQVNLVIEDFIEYWENDDSIKEIFVYSEGITNPKRLLEISSRVAKKKPIFIYKAGFSPEGKRAAKKHTGSIAGSYRLASGLYEQAGLFREKRIKSIFNDLKAFKYKPYPKGNRVAIITSGGGIGIITTDDVATQGFVLAKFEEETVKKLKSFLLPIASTMNPVDMVASASIENFEKAIDACVNDPNVDIIFVLNVRLRIDALDIAKAVIKKKAQYPDKCIVAVFAFEDDFYIKLSKLDVNMPFFKYPEDAAESMQKIIQYQKWINRPEGKIPKFYDIQKDIVEKILNKYKERNEIVLEKNEVFKILESYGLKVQKIKEISHLTRQFCISLGYDEDYKHYIKFGLGGPLTDFLDNFKYRILPIKDIDAKEMIETSKTFGILGSRENMKKANIEKIQEYLLRISQLSSDFDTIETLNINPLLIDPETGDISISDGDIKLKL